MYYVNGVCLVSLIFILCLRNAVCNQRRLRSYEHELNNSSKAIRVSIIGNRHLRAPNNSARPQRRDTTVEERSAAITLDNDGLNMQTMAAQSRPPKSVQFRKQNFMFATRWPLHLSTYADSDVSHPTSLNDLTAANVSANMGRQNSSAFDFEIGTTYLCFSDKDCNSLLEKSFCQTSLWLEESGHCKCFFPYHYDGETCRNSEDINYCTSHEDCTSRSEDSRCVFVQMTGEKLCKCNPNRISFRQWCLQKAGYLEKCVSKKQCPWDMPCTGGICRHECQIGYFWKHGLCIRENSDPSPRNKSILTNPVFILSILGCVVFVLFLVTTLLLWRRLAKQHSMANGVDRLRSENSPSQRSYESYESRDDQPPSYDEVITDSRLTLTANASPVNEDPPPSYSSWEEAQRNYVAALGK